jgi:hypothetical protein
MAKKEPMYPHVSESKYPRMLPTTRTSEEFIPARDLPYKGPPGRIGMPKYGVGRTARTEYLKDLKRIYEGLLKEQQEHPTESKGEALKNLAKSIVNLEYGR